METTNGIMMAQERITMATRKVMKGIESTRADVAMVTMMTIFPVRRRITSANNLVCFTAVIYGRSAMVILERAMTIFRRKLA